MRILLTNDDGVQSPLLAATMSWAASLGEVTYVLPKTEQSWRGKSVTRFEYLHVEEHEIHGKPCFLVDGTPADCVNLAMYNLCPEKPDLVVSGINTGSNAGIGFLFSSGTVGACFEANIGRVPGIALSQTFERTAWNTYATTGTLPEEVLARLLNQIPRVLDRVKNTFVPGGAMSDELLGRPITWNINIPFVVSEPIALTPCAVAHTMYGSCFVRQGSHYRHQLSEREIWLDKRDNVDSRIARAGQVAVTPLDLCSFGQYSATELENLRILLARDRT